MASSLRVPPPFHPRRESKKEPISEKNGQSLKNDPPRKTFPRQRTRELRGARKLNSSSYGGEINSEVSRIQRTWSISRINLRVDRKNGRRLAERDREQFQSKGISVRCVELFLQSFRIRLKIIVVIQNCRERKAFPRGKARCSRFHGQKNYARVCGRVLTKPKCSVTWNANCISPRSAFRWLNACLTFRDNFQPRIFPTFQFF